MGFGVARDGAVEVWAVLYGRSLPSSQWGGFGDVAIFWGLGVKNHPPKKVLDRVWG